MTSLIENVNPPPGWTLRPLRYLANLNPETLSESHDPEAEIAYIDIGSVGRGELVEQPEVMTFHEAPSRARRIVRDGDILVSTVRTYLRAVVRLEGLGSNTVASTGFAALRPASDADSRYLHYWCLSDPFVETVVAKSKGVSYPAINASELLSLPVALPSLETQRRVADMLDAETARIDSLIAKNQDLVRLNGIRRRILVEEVTKPRDGCRTVPLRFVLREVDERVGTADTELPLLSVSISSGVGRRSTDSKGQVASDDLSNYKICRSGDIVLNRMRAFQGAVGVADEDGVVSSDYAVLRSQRGLPRYFHHVMRAPWFVGEMTRRLRGIGDPTSVNVRTPRINVTDLGLIDVPLPAKQEQHGVVAALDREFAIQERLTDAVGRQTAALKLKRQALITAAVTGQITV